MSTMRTSRVAGFGGGAGVVEGGGGVSALAGLDEGDVGAGGPDFELLDGGGAEGVGGAEEDGAALAAVEGSEFAGGGGFAGAVDADHHDDFGGRASAWRDGSGDPIEDGFELEGEEAAELVAGLDALAHGAAGGGFRGRWRWWRSRYRRRGGRIRGRRGRSRRRRG